MSFSIIDVQTNTLEDAGGFSTLDVPVPAGTQSGDIVFLFAVDENPSFAVTTVPSEFTAIASISFGEGTLDVNTSSNIWGWYKRVTSPESGTYTVDFHDVSRFADLFAIAIRNNEPRAITYTFLPNFHLEHSGNMPVNFFSVFRPFPNDLFVLGVYVANKSLSDPAPSFHPEATPLFSHLMTDGNLRSRFLSEYMEVPGGTQLALSAGSNGTATTHGGFCLGISWSLPSSTSDSDDEKIWARGAFGYGFGRGYA